MGRVGLEIVTMRFLEVVGKKFKNAIKKDKKVPVKGVALIFKK